MTAQGPQGPRRARRTLGARAALAALAASLFGAAPTSAQAFSPFLVVPDAAVAEQSPAYRYANMTDDEAFAELERRGVAFTREAPIGTVRAPIRLAGLLHGVWFHSSLPAEARAQSVFEILDARLALALDDFAAVLERHDIDEVVHYTMYRPNVPRPEAEGAPEHAAHGPARPGPELASRANKASAEKAPSPPEKASADKPSPAAGRASPDKAHPLPEKASSAANKAPSANKASPEKASPAADKASPEKASSPVDKASPAKGAAPTDKASPAKGADKPPATADKHARGRAPAEPPAKAGKGAPLPPLPKPLGKGARDGKAGHDAAGAKQKVASGEPKPREAPTGSKSAVASAKAPPSKQVAKREATARRALDAHAVAAPEPAVKAAVKPRGTWAPPGTRHPAGLAIDVGLLHRRGGGWLNVLAHFQGHLGDKTCGDGAYVPESSDARELRALVCEAQDLGVFTYVLTPNFNAAHADHFHMEIKPGVRWFLYH